MMKNTQKIKEKINKMDDSELKNRLKNDLKSKGDNKIVRK